MFRCLGCCIFLAAIFILASMTALVSIGVR